MRRENWRDCQSDGVKSKSERCWRQRQDIGCKTELLVVEINNQGPVSKLIS